MNLLDFMTGARPWGQLDRLLAHLPRHSHYRAALDDDDDTAQLALALHGEPEDDEAKPTVPLEGYSPVVKRLDDATDAILSLRDTVVSALSSRKSSFQQDRTTRPETAIQRIRREQKKNKLLSLEDQLTPRG